LKEVKILILDEADRMFDMGFAPQVDKIVSKVSKDRQTMLFSATMPPSILRLATDHMKLPIHVEIAPQGTAAEKVTQELFIVPEDKKKDVLKVLLDQYSGSILLFIRTKSKASRISRLIKKLGHNAIEIHSDRTMAQRKQAIEGFKCGKHRILVATDIAARGIDVTALEVVINYDLPDDSENYVHRIGRTGRAGETGHAISFATPDQRVDVIKIEGIIRKALPRGTHPDIQEHQFSKPARIFSWGPGGGRSRGPSRSGSRKKGRRGR